MSNKFIKQDTRIYQTADRNQWKIHSNYYLRLEVELVGAQCENSARKIRGEALGKVQTDRQPLFKHDKLKSCTACGVVRKY